MTAKDRLLAVALAEEGYLEKASNAQLDSKTANAGSANYTKYYRDLDALEAYNTPKNGYAWCTGFVLWCFTQAFGFRKALDMTYQYQGSYGASCMWLADRYKLFGALANSPEVGDQIFFADADGDPSHTGIVIRVTDDKVYTIEGNTSAVNNVVIANGGGVWQKSYTRGNRRIYGYGRPQWSLVETEEETELTEERIREIIREEIEEHETDIAMLDGSGWSEEDRKWAVEQGFFKGDGSGGYMWQAPVTREQLAAVLRRFAGRD